MINIYNLINLSKEQRLLEILNFLFDKGEFMARELLIKKYKVKV